LEEIEVFTYQQIKAMREHRYGGQQGERHREQHRDRVPGSLHELLMSVAARLARVRTRDDEEKVRPASPAY
jgi:hypothetical protein